MSLSSPSRRRAHVLSLPTVDERSEDAVKAERLWWCEASERQVKELGESFEQQFRMSSDRVRSDVAACQDRTEMLLESERRTRTAAILDLRQDMEQRFREFEARLSKAIPASERGLGSPVRQRRSLSASGQEENSFLASACTPRASLPDVDSQILELRQQIQELRMDFAVSETKRNTEESAFRKDLEASKEHNGQQQDSFNQCRVQLSALEAAMADVHREMAGIQESQVISLQDLRRDVETMREKARLEKESNDEVSALHQFFMQSVGDLGGGIEEVSAGVLATEKKLRQEAEARACALEDKCTKQHTELLEALARSGDRMAQCVSDEVEKRAAESNTLRARVDSLHNQVSELLASEAAGVQPALPSTAMSAKEGDTLRALMDTSRSDLSKLERAAAEDRVANASTIAELKCHLENVRKTAVDRVETLEADLRAYISERFAAERSSRARELSDVKSYAEDILSGAGKAVAEATASRCADSLTVPVHVAHSSSQDQEAIWEELQRLKLSVEDLAADERLSGIDSRKTMFTALSRKMDALEERCDLHQVMAARLNSVEGELREVARVPELRRLDAELKRLELDVMPLDSRFEQLESELRRANLATSVLLPRLDAAESEAARLARDGVSANAAVATLKCEVDVIKGRLSFAGVLADKTTCGTSDVSTAVPTEQHLDLTQCTCASLTPQQAKDGGGGAALPPSDLKSSINMLVNKVNHTLNLCSSPGKVAESPREFTPRKFDDTRKFDESFVSASSSSSVPLKDGADPKMADVEAGKATFRKALSAVRELRERNLQLREANAELAEELMLTQDVGSSVWAPASQTATLPPEGPQLMTNPLSKRKCMRTPRVSGVTTSSVSIAQSGRASSPSRTAQRASSETRTLVRSQSPRRAQASSCGSQSARLAVPFGAASLPGHATQMSSSGAAMAAGGLPPGPRQSAAHVPNLQLGGMSR